MKLCFVKRYGLYAVGDVIEPTHAGVVEELLRRGLCKPVDESQASKSHDAPAAHKMVRRETVTRKAQHGR